MRRIDHKIAYILILIVFLGTGSAFVAKYIIETKNDTTKIKNQVVEEIVPLVTESLVPAASEAIKEQITKEPPKHITKQTVTTVPSGGGQVTTISSSDSDLSKYLNNCKPSSVASGVSFTDETGLYSGLGTILAEYLNRLRWGGEIGSLCGVYVKDAGKTGWEGQYVASYRTDGGGHIVSATGAIILNTYYRKTSPQFNQYMELVLSHEYGHHYTQYHKWIDLNLPAGVRFPDGYYSIRPLAKSATITDCSVSWETCDSEIIAEDYSYLYSGFGFHQMADLFGYPSMLTKNWLDALSSYQLPVPEPEPTPEPTPTPTPTPTNQNTNSVPSNTNSNTNTNSADTTKPVVTIIDPATNPFDWDSSVKKLPISVRATDNVAVTKINVYINNQLVATENSSELDRTWAYDNAPAGTYLLKAEAYDSAGNIGEATLLINKI